MPPEVLPLLTAFFGTLGAIVVLAPLASKVGLIDIPSNRKQHQHPTPLIGGLAIFVTFVFWELIWSTSYGTTETMRDQNAFGILLSCSAFLVFTGILDDRFNLGVLMRIASELLVAIAVIELLDLRLTWLGNLMGTGEIRMPPTFSYLFTVVAIFGLINAFNMLDGIDGLLATMVITTTAAFHLFTVTQPGLISLFVMASLSAFLVSNLRLWPLIPKSFLGDAGSKLLGFVIACFLLAAASSQVGDQKLINPVTALYLVAVPLFDMVFTTLRRVFNRSSPFKADRTHIHHLLLKLGFSDRRTLFIIATANIAACSIGLVLYRLNAPDYYQLGIFLGMFSFYCLLSSQAWIVANKISGHLLPEHEAAAASQGDADSLPSKSAANKITVLK